MNNFRMTTKRVMLLITVFLVVIIVVSTRYSDRASFVEDALGFIIVPIQKGITNITGKIGEMTSYNKDVDALNEENRALKQEVAQLKDENKRLALFEKENEELNTLLKVNQKYPNYDKLGAQVISADTSNWYNVFTVDRGEKDGVKPDMFVVADGGLVGKVLEVGRTHSTIITLIDERSAFYAQSRQTEDTGVVKGNIMLMRNNLCQMDYIDLHAEIAEGDEIMTSTVSMYPAGLTIGYVQEISTAPDGLTKYALIEPAVDFKHLNKVLIVLHTPDSLDEEDL